MPLFLVKAASTSSSAFFIEAAAKTVMDLSCAAAVWAATIVGAAEMTMAAASAARTVLFSTRVLQSSDAHKQSAADRVIRKSRRYDCLENHRSRLIRRAHGPPHVAQGS